MNKFNENKMKIKTGIEAIIIITDCMEKLGYSIEDLNLMDTAYITRATKEVFENVENKRKERIELTDRLKAYDKKEIQVKEAKETKEAKINEVETKLNTVLNEYQVKEMKSFDGIKPTLKGTKMIITKYLNDSIAWLNEVKNHDHDYLHGEKTYKLLQKANRDYKILNRINELIKTIK